jgi:hypothetical protein
MYSLAANATGITVLSVNGPRQAKIFQRVDIASPAKAANLSIREQLLSYAHLPTLKPSFTDSSNLQGMATFIGK